MEKNSKKTKYSFILNIIKVIAFLTIVIIIFIFAQNYEKKDLDNNKINLIINNKNVTQKLKYDLFLNDKNVIYMSKEDIKNYFDRYIYIEEESNKIITTYGEKIGVFTLNENSMIINNANVNILSGAIKKDNIYYLPISAMSNIYNVNIEYLSDKKILILDSLDREQIKADVTKNCSVKYKSSSISKTVDKIKKGDKVICIEQLKNNWSKIRTKNGKIGYVKTKLLQNKVIVRENIEKDKNIEKINMVWEYFSEYGTAPNRNGTKIKGVNVVSPAFFSLVKEKDGQINVNVKNNGINYIEWAKNNNCKVWAMFSNNSYKDTTSKVLNSYELRTNLINSIVSLAVQYDLDGINIDFENMYAEDKDMFSRFIIELKPKLQEAGITLSVDVTAPDGGSDWSECYNRNVIGNVADYIIFMAYDQYTGNSKKAGTTAGFNWVETNLKKFIEREEIPSNKVILGIPFYTRLWKIKDNTVSSQTVNMNKIDTVLPEGIEKIWNDELKQYYVEYSKNGYTYKMWIEDEESIKNKVSLVKKYNLGGVAAWTKDREKENIWDIIEENIK